jgi:hypothetical protein
VKQLILDTPPIDNSEPLQRAPERTGRPAIVVSRAFRVRVDSGLHGNLEEERVGQLDW